MLNFIKSFFKEFFTLSKSEQRGIIVFSILIIIMIISTLLIPVFHQKEKVDHSAFQSEIEKFYQAQQILSDSIQIEKLQNRGELDFALAERKIKPFPFDPNNLSENQWIKMGFTPKQAKSIKNYEAKGGKFKTKEDVKKMYAISPVEYQLLAPYILLPDKTEFESRKSKDKEFTQSKSNYPEKRTPETIELNAADSAALVDKLLLSPWQASRVVKYRNLLGGYYQASQLSEVYGFSQTVLSRSLPYVLVDTTLIIKIDLNNSTFKEILRHPYTNYEMTQAIVNKRQKEGKYKSVNELKEITLISDSIYHKLRPYIKVSLQ